MLGKVVIELGWRELLLCGAASLAGTGALADTLPIGERGRLLDFEGSPTVSLRQIGINTEFSLTHFGQQQINGSGSGRFENSGVARALINIDGEKLGLWRGFFATVDYEHTYGTSPGGVLNGDGVILPINTAYTFPRLNGDNNALSINFTQAFSENVLFSFGKFNAASLASKTPILGGGGIEGFMNTALAAPVSGVVPPYFAGGILTVKTNPAVFTALVYDPRNADDSGVLKDLFSEGATFGLAATVPVRVGELPAFHSIKGYYSTQDGFDLNNLPQLQVPPSMRGPIGDADNYWYLSYGYQQSLVSLGDGKSWGLFFEAGISDGNPNPIQGHVFAGLAGDSPFVGRRDDTWGIAAYRYNFSEPLKDAGVAVGFPIQDEKGLEVFYSFAVADWARMTADLQFIEPAQADRETAIFAGLRLEVKF
ncbi:carbohydrate porin [Parasedimentitalea maritima]|uniref:Carbohydrate porin n=1 Tax=Parasedimentitalea maritima TaxID=2578117 RepID=A0ABY2UNH9_9RHOB|nr:carbohydrate porin [Zongyanglinia marina]